MPLITYSDFHSIMNLTISDISAENTEKILDLAIDCLNLYSNADLSNMSGLAGSKTVSLESKEKAAVFIVARAIYLGFYKGPMTGTISGLSVTVADVFSNATVVETIKEAARQLAEIEVSTG